MPVLAFSVRGESENCSQKGKSLREVGRRFWNSLSRLWAEEGSGPTFSSGPKGCSLREIIRKAKKLELWLRQLAYSP